VLLPSVRRSPTARNAGLFFLLQMPAEIEDEPSIVVASAHLIAVARKR
jgi:hypothetical protein